MGEEEVFIAKLCDERHKFIADELKSLGNKITWFYLLAIVTLTGVVATYLKVN